MKVSSKNIIVGASLSVMLAFVFVPQLFAHEGDHDTPVAQAESSNKGSGKEAQKRTEVKSDDSTESEDSSAEVENERDNPRGEVRKEEARKKLDDNKKAVCESRQSTVNKAFENVTTRSKNHFDRITTIYELATKFYTDKGLTVANYDALVATVETAKTAAAAANQELVSVPAFSCDSDGPRADIQSFRNKRLDKVAAFADYRTAVKALVTAIKEAAKAAEATTTTEGAN